MNPQIENKQTTTKVPKAFTKDFILKQRTEWVRYKVAVGNEGFRDNSSPSKLSRGDCCGLEKPRHFHQPVSIINNEGGQT